MVIGNDSQCCKLTNLVEKLTKLSYEVGHVEFVEINIIMQSKASSTQHVVENWLVKKWPFSLSDTS